MAGLMEEEMRNEIRKLEKAKQKLQSAIAVYVDPVLRDASVVLHMPVTDTKQLKENIVALKEYSNICFEVEDVLRHKCGDASSISIDITGSSQKDHYDCISNLQIENESLEESCRFYDSLSDSSTVNDGTIIHAPTNSDANYSDSNSSSVVTVLERKDLKSAQLQSTRREDVIFAPPTQEVHETSVMGALKALEELEENLQSETSIDASYQSNQISDESLQSDNRGLEIGQMLLEAKYQFVGSLPIGLDDLFRTPDDVLSPLSKRDGEWTLTDKKAEWELDDNLNCFFPRHPGHYAMGVNWQQSGNGILKVSVGTKDRTSGVISQFPDSTICSRTQNDGERGRRLFKCYLSSRIGLWVSVCRLSFNPKLLNFTLTCQRCAMTEKDKGPSERDINTSLSKMPFYN